MSFSKVMIVIGGLLVAAGCVYLLSGFVFYRAIYHFDQNTETPVQLGLTGVGVAHITSEDGAPIDVWIKRPEKDAPVIFYFMGSGGSIGQSVERISPFLDKGLGVAALVYRGSSGAGGTPSEDAFAADARAVYDQLDAMMGEDIPPARRVVHGYSLGTGVATHLAADRAVAALVLEAAYPRFCRYFTDRFFNLPFCYIMYRERYDSIDRIANINAALLMLHGEKDTTLNIDSARELFAAAKEPKRFIAYKDGTHVNLGRSGLVADTLVFYGQVVPGDWFKP